MLSRVQHPNVVKLLDHGKAGRYDFLALEWIEGPSLRRVIADAEESGKSTDFMVAFHDLLAGSRTERRDRGCDVEHDVVLHPCPGSATSDTACSASPGLIRPYRFWVLIPVLMVSGRILSHGLATANG